MIQKNQKIKAAPKSADAPLRGREELKLAALKQEFFPLPPSLCIQAADFAKAGPPVLTKKQELNDPALQGKEDVMPHVVLR